MAAKKWRHTSRLGSFVFEKWGKIFKRVISEACLKLPKTFIWGLKAAILKCQFWGCGWITLFIRWQKMLFVFATINHFILSCILISVIDWLSGWWCIYISIYRVLHCEIISTGLWNDTMHNDRSYALKNPEIQWRTTYGPSLLSFQLIFHFHGNWQHVLYSRLILSFPHYAN